MINTLKNILFFLVVLFSLFIPVTTYAADWKYVESSKGVDFYLDISDIQKYDDKIQFWTKMFIEDPFKYNNVKTIIRHIEVKLGQKNRYRSLKTLYYDVNGNNTFKYMEPTKWDDVIKDSALNNTINVSLQYLSTKATKSNWIIITDYKDGSYYMVDTVNIKKEIDKLYYWTSWYWNVPEKNSGIQSICSYNELDLSRHLYRVLRIDIYEENNKLVSHSDDEPGPWLELKEGTEEEKAVNKVLTLSNL